MSAIQKVEVVVLPIKIPFIERLGVWLAIFLTLNLRALFVFWLVATWFPQLGLTYWQLLLPLYVASWVLSPISIKGRFIPGRRLRRTSSYDTAFEELTLEQAKEREEVDKLRK